MKYLSLLLLLFAILPSMAHAQEDDLLAVKQDTMLTYADMVYASYADAYELVAALQEALTAFVADPTEETFQAAKDAWLAAREPYGQTEAYRFYGGPVDDADGPEGLINAWPLDEVYIDYVDGAPDSGIINNVADYPEITAEVLESLNEQGAEENISVGFHAIEFLLWGQDLSADSAGQRPLTDFTTALNAERRGEYLLVVSELLAEHVDFLVQAWSPDVADNYRAEFLALEPDVALGHMLTGIGVLSKSELAGERMFTAYDNQDQEDEHSCFSDNTHRDIINNTQGVANVYRGSYTRLDGTEISGSGLSAVVDIANPDLNAQILEQLDLTLQLTQEIPVPFDQAIVSADGRPLVLDAVFALQDQGDLIAAAAGALGISINTALPE
jgi:putative iron-regulated protein